MEGWLSQEFEKNKQKMGEAYEKYDHPGIYGIKLGEKVVYVGKSVNMAQRILNHMIQIEHMLRKTNKYKVLHEAQEAGQVIQFTVLSYCPEEEIGYEEARLIHELHPALNYQIPKLDSPNNFTVNKRAKYITLKEICGSPGSEIG